MKTCEFAYNKELLTSGGWDYDVIVWNIQPAERGREDNSSKQLISLKDFGTPFLLQLIEKQIFGKFQKRRTRLFDLSRFGHETFQSWSFRSRGISVRLWNLAEILYVHFSMQTYLNQRKILLKLQTWSKIQQLISMNVWFSLSSASILNHFRHFQLNTNTHNYNSDLIAIMTLRKGVGKHQLAWHLACLYNNLNKQMQSVAHIQKCRDRNVPRPKRPDRKVLFREKSIIWERFQQQSWHLR